MAKDFFSHLSSKERSIIVKKGTEASFSGEYNNHFEPGIFICKACEFPLYQSNTKFDSGCGWPSFDDEIRDAINRFPDNSMGKKRTEICCAKCGGHLGHVFQGENMTKKNIRHCVNSLSIKFIPYTNFNTATFGAGCFWGPDRAFKQVNGVYVVQVGYMGGNTTNPSYEDVCSGKTNHAEVIQIIFDNKRITYNNLLDLFWKIHNPTILNQQGFDIGTQYRSVIFYYSETQKKEAEESKKGKQLQLNDLIVTQIIPKKKFYRAEEYHQDYLNKNNLGSCEL